MSNSAREPRSTEDVQGSLLALILDVIPYVVFWKDLRSVYLGCNRNFAMLAGRASPADVVGLDDYDLPWAKAESDAYRADDAIVMQSGKPKLHIIETQRTAEGKDTWLDTSKVPLRDRCGEVIGVLGIYADITELKDAETSLQRTRQHLEDAIEAIDAGLVMYDAADRLIFCNENYRRIYAEVGDSLVPGADYRDILTRYAACRPDLLGDGIAAEWAAERVAQHRRFQRWEKCLGQRTILVSDRPTRDQGLVSLHTDITPEKQRQHELQRAKEAAVAASVAKTNFLANLSHEIRTPMSAILGFTDVLTNASPRPDQVNALETIQRNAGHLLDLIDDILDLSKVEAGKLRVDRCPVDLVTLIGDVSTLMTERAHAKGLRFEVEIQGRMPKVLETDAIRFRQILMNLVGNSIKFTLQGQVRMVLHGVGEGTTAACLHVDVVDTGIGIAAQDLDRVFEPFEQADASTTRRFGGCGLGLPISRQLARLLGGDIVVESAVGVGSRFRFTHPLAASAVWCDAPKSVVGDQAPIVKAKVPLPSLAGVSVLVVEDGPDNRRLFAQFLETAGARVEHAFDGVDALERCDAMPPADRSYDVILMDMQMPRLDGYETTRRLRERGWKVPIIALTAHAMAGDRQRCIDAGCDDYLAKPVRRGALVTTTHDWVHAASRPPATGDDRPS